jgi:transposase
LPEDPATLKALLLAALTERDREQQRAEEQAARAAEQGKRADDLYLQTLRLQLELERYKKWYYGPRADRLQASGELGQALLNFGEELERTPVHPEDVAAGTAPASEGRPVQRRRGRRALTNFENLPVTTQVYELSGKERACPCCGVERQEIGAETSWQIEYIPGHFERIQHLRKKYACPRCERAGENPRIAVAGKSETAIEKGFAGPRLLAFIVTSKFADYLPLYRLEDIFERQGFEISRATQSVWCGDVEDLVEPLYERMAERVRKSHVVATDDTILPMLSPSQTQPARMCVYMGDEGNPYNVFDFTLHRGRKGPKHFLKEYTQVLLADAYGGYNGVVAGNAITRAGCWSHARRKSIDAEKSGAGDGARSGRFAGRAVCRGKTGQGHFRCRATGAAAEAVVASVGGAAPEAGWLEGTVAAKASHGRSGELRPRAVGGAERVHNRWCRAHR